MQLDRYELILASKSPRRKELLGWIDIPFRIISLEIDEISSFSNPTAVCKDIATQKGKAVFNHLKEEKSFLGKFIVSSDTIVTCDGIIYGKPDSIDEASQMLLALSGKEHNVITSVYMCFVDSNRILHEHVFACETKVTFANISMDILDNYLKTGDSLDKAGAYGIQGKGLTFISKIEGSYSNVVGFPLDTFIQELKTFLGYNNDEKGEWRENFVR